MILVETQGRCGLPSLYAGSLWEMTRVATWADETLGRITCEWRLFGQTNCPTACAACGCSGCSYPGLGRVKVMTAWSVQMERLFC